MENGGDVAHVLSDDSHSAENPTQRGQQGAQGGTAEEAPARDLLRQQRPHCVAEGVRCSVIAVLPGRLKWGFLSFSPHCIAFDFRATHAKKE
ncbi:unnamed protein product [Symbiodinium natans]|uniref:Uncharacterized protein n=1 Tax=Symbiodinium natans TaxID=878477 RepID=A0A812J947_9DINO|nr:unnamed protein product [Symbiodinium natans]